MQKEIVEIIIRSVASLVVLYLLAKMMGKKQISQLNFFDYIIGISIGSIAAASAIEFDVSLVYALIAMSIYAGFESLISYCTCKSMKFRRFFTGKPVFLMINGKFIEKNMLRVRFDINDFLTECRCSGYFDVSDIYCAVMETNGRISFLPKSLKRPATPEDLSIEPQPASLLFNLIIDGKVLERNLKACGKDYSWLSGELKSQGVKSEKKVLLAVCDKQNNLKIFLKNSDSTSGSIFE